MEAGALFETAEAPLTVESLRFPPPRAFQLPTVSNLYEGVRDGHRVQVVVAPTGAGKLYILLWLIARALLKGKRAILVCERNELINQASAKADEYGLTNHGIMQADHWRYGPDRPLQIASAQTLIKRGWPKNIDLFCWDECHVLMKTCVEFAKQTSAHVVGATATPFTKGMGKVFTRLVNAATMHELTENGVLVPMVVRTCTGIDMDGAEIANGEWSDASSGERGMRIIGDAVTEWHKHAEGEKTITFGSTVAECEAMCQQYNQSGVMAGVFCYNTPTNDRARMMEEFKKRDSALRILLSVSALGRGVDVPDIGCVQDMRPLRRSFSEFVQEIGRGARSCEATSKRRFILLDHTRNFHRFREDFEELYFNGVSSLDDGEKLDKKVRKEPDEHDIRGCPKCGFKPFTSRCMGCGHEVSRLSLVEHEAAGGMVEIRIGKAKAAENAAELWAMCCTYAKSGGNPDKAYGRARHAYKSMMNGQDPPRSFPRFDDAPWVPPSKAVKGKIQSSRIAYLKATGRA